MAAKDYRRLNMKNLKSHELDAVDGAGETGRAVGSAIGRAVTGTDAGAAVGGEIGSRIEDAVKEFFSA